MPKLDPRPARPLTSRELAKLLTGLVGGLCEWCDPEDVKAALQFVASDAYFDEMARSNVEFRKLVAELQGPPTPRDPPEGAS